MLEGRPEWISFHSDFFELQGFDILAPTRTNARITSGGAEEASSS